MIRDPHPLLPESTGKVLDMCGNCKIMLSCCTGRTIDGKRDVKEDGAVLQIPEFASDSVDPMFRYIWVPESSMALKHR